MFPGQTARKFDESAEINEAASGRQKFAGFVQDGANAKLLMNALGSNIPAGCEPHVANFRTALNVLSRMATPEIILVDLTGEDQPVNAMLELAEHVEPGTKVLLIGETHELSFYRTVVEGMGVQEYLAKPLSRETVARYFLPYFRAEEGRENTKRGGRMIAVTGARGGVGTSTIAANLAWAMGHETHRHTLLLDADLHAGTGALTLNKDAGKGLVTALQSPERLDTMLLERVTHQIGERLHLLAAQEDFTRLVDYIPGSATVLTQSLRQRYNFVIADAGAKLLPFARDLLFVTQQHVIILDPSIAAMRNFERVSTLPASSRQATQPVVVLNRAGRPGGLSQKYMEQSLGLHFNAVIPDLPRIVPKADQFGDMAASLRGPFRNGILKLAEILGATALNTKKAKIAVMA